MDAMVQQAWKQYRAWAATSRGLKARTERSERLVLVLTIAGTLSGSMAPFISTPWGGLSTAAAWGGAVCLGLATFIANQLLATSERQAWTRARAIAEALKSESYKYVMGTSPYDDPGTRAPLLAQKIDESVTSMKDVVATRAPDAAKTGFPDAAWSLEEYIEKRVVDQIERFYKPGVARHRQATQRARRTAIGLGALATVLSVSGAAVEGSFPAALLGTVTTAGAAIAAYYQGGRHQQIAINYQMTLSRLDSLLALQRTSNGDPQKFVSDVEAVLQSEHAAWLAEWRR